STACSRGYSRPRPAATAQTTSSRSTARGWSGCGRIRASGSSSRCAGSTRATQAAVAATRDDLAQLREKRCLIPADGFYEWKAEGKKKRRCYFSLKGGRPFGFAGLWDLWRGDGKPLLSCCLVTTVANDLVKPVHDRMPVILPRAGYGEWLDPETPVER